MLLGSCVLGQQYETSKLYVVDAFPVLLMVHACNRKAQAIAKLDHCTPVGLSCVMADCTNTHGTPGAALPLAKQCLQHFTES